MFRFLDTHDEWIVDGVYSSPGVASRTMAEATDIIWLDPPRLLYWPRIFARTMRRLLGLEPEQNVPEGCKESWKATFFSSDSILWYCFTRHAVVRRRFTPMWEASPVETGGKWRRLRGWGTEARLWFNQVELIAKTRPIERID